MRTSALFVLTAIVATLSSIGGIAAAAQADVTPVARDLLAEALRARQMADADALASASQALSIYNNVGTKAFAAPTGLACAPGLQSYTTPAGIVRCCTGSIVNNRCFQDTAGLVYPADPEAVLDGAATAPAATAATTTSAIGADPDTPIAANPSVASASSSSSFSFASSYKPTATGGTLRAQTATLASRTDSRLSQSLTPTGGNSASNDNTGNASGAASFPSSSAMPIMLIALVAAVAGGRLFV